MWYLSIRLVVAELNWSSSLARSHDIRAFHCGLAFFCLVYYPFIVDCVGITFGGLDADVVLTLDSDKNMLSGWTSCEQRNSFQRDWITSRVIRRLVAWYTDYCLNEIDQMFRKCV